MKKIIESLFELQNAHLQSKMNPEERESQIAAFRKKIPLQMLATFDRFQVRGKKAVSVVRNGVCAECHLGIPIGVVTALASSGDAQRCGNCGRYLYLPPASSSLPPSAPVEKPAKRRKKESAKELAHAI